MRRFLKSRFFLASLCIVLLLTAASLFAAFAGTVSPVEQAVSAAAKPGERFFSKLCFVFTDFYHTFTRYDALEAENTALQARIAQLEYQARQYEALEAENETLRQMLSMKQRDQRIDYLPAPVLAVAAGGWNEQYMLDCGSADGIEAGMYAVTVNGLVGRIGECGDSSCTLLPITAPGASCSARSSRTQDTGILEGSLSLQERGLVRLSYLDADADIQVGDVIETAGAGGVCPEGIAVGLVCEVGLEEHALSAYALIRPFASLRDAQQVYIVTGSREA